MPLATLAQLKEALGETADTDDTRLTRILNAASGYCERYCRRTFASATYTNELYDGSGRDVLLLNHFPIITLTSVSEYGTALTVGVNPTDGADVFPDKPRGAIIRPDARFIACRMYYDVTYDAGYASVPDEVVQSCIDVASIMVREKDRIGLGSKSAGQQTTSYIREIPEMSRQTLDLYRNFSLMRAA